MILKEQDLQIALSKVKEVEFSINLIKERLPQTLEEFLKLDVLVRDGIYKRIEFAIQNILDILAIIAKYVKILPSDDMSLIRKLQQQGIISRRIADKIREMKAFRNFLVHRYGDMFEEQAFRDIKDGLNDFYFVLDELKKTIRNIDP